MPNREDEDRLLRSVARQNSTSIQLARQRSEEALVQAKDALETKTRELAESLALMRATLEATHDAILVTDVRGAVTHFNEQFVEMWRFSRDLLEARQHRPLLDAASGHFADPESFLTRVAEIYGSLHEASDELRLRDGRIIERFSKLQQLEGRAVGRVWTFRDVTER